MALDIVSHGRRGPGGSVLTPEQIEQVSRTVHRAPEVVVKVSGGARDAGGAKAHADYIGRHGKLGLETDEGERVVGRDAGARLVADWNLDLSRGQYRPLSDRGRDTRPKVVHNIVLSMPGRTPPEAVLEAARTFARENFALQYRYAMVLHTDQAHPHVHLVVKAEHECGGPRLTIRKAMLRRWREEFAAALRAQGVPANATPAPLRGRATGGMKDSIFRRLRALADAARAPDQPGRTPVGSTFMRAKVERIAWQLQQGALPVEPGLARLQATRQSIIDDWRSTAQALRRQGEEALAREVERYIQAFPPVRTDAMRIAERLQSRWAESGATRGAAPDPGSPPPPQVPTEPSPRVP
ncbi:MAG: relaxase/mobilization nuclease domain-containing protein [Proteobacteria bacterium]|nr:relaxase/mobilization nuclease domain-containing protein [Pseudomonadota bacterium]